MEAQNGQGKNVIYFYRYCSDRCNGTDYRCDHYFLERLDDKSVTYFSHPDSGGKAHTDCFEFIDADKNRYHITSDHHYCSKCDATPYYARIVRYTNAWSWLYDDLPS